ncbi:HET-domain-containing protein, partial [Polychaeton citri CBS 116435]
MRLKPEHPSRLVKLSLSNLPVQTVCLINTEQRPYRYATLSYCWGKIHGDTWFTTKSNLMNQLNSISVHGLPLTLQQSIEISSKLGIEYLWIDALCIIQDDTTDWSSEASRMGAIYHGSVLTIGAASSSSSYDGCFNKNSHSAYDALGEVIQVDGTLSDGRKSSICFHRAGPNNVYLNEVLEGTLAKRAWTFQEQALSRRILYYTNSQLIWDCQHVRLAEDNSPIEDSNRLYPVLDLYGSMSYDVAVRLWYWNAVPQYSNRHLSFTSDKMVALSALAKATYLNRRVDYIAGLWKDSLLTGLMWARDGPGNKTKTYRCPSWSWASQDSPVNYML